MKLLAGEMYLVQRDWGGVPASLVKRGAAVEARSESGRDLVALFPALRGELLALSEDCELSGLLYLYRGWTRQPRAVVREVVLGRRSPEGLVARIDVLDRRGDGSVEERRRAVEALFWEHPGMILRPALTDVLSGGECAVLLATGAMHLVVRALSGDGEPVRLAGEGCRLLRCGHWERRELGDGLSELALWDGERRRYAGVHGFAPDRNAQVGPYLGFSGAAWGELADWRLPALGEHWRAVAGEYRIEEEDEHAEA
ncbi:hypothetical protein HS125_16995 [bacterium]|nr:hypothetical protein [bacterium]